MKPILLEVCIESVDDAVTAVEAGADRLELNAALRLGGISPSIGLLVEVRGHIGPQVPIIGMLRPREGDFRYGDREFDVMRRDVDLYLELGASGVALGILTAENRVDHARCRQLVEQVQAHAGASEGAVFHRAFDFVADPLAAIDELIELGFRRAMTSGQCASASEGAAEIARYIEHAAGRIEILPAAGIRPDNVQALIVRTGCDQVHGSFREPIPATTDDAAPSFGKVHLAAGLFSGELVRSGTSGRVVREMLEKIGR